MPFDVARLQAAVQENRIARRDLRWLSRVGPADDLSTVDAEVLRTCTRAAGAAWTGGASGWKTTEGLQEAAVAARAVLGVSWGGGSPGPGFDVDRIVGAARKGQIGRVDLRRLAALHPQATCESVPPWLRQLFVRVVNTAWTGAATDWNTDEVLHQAAEAARSAGEALRAQEGKPPRVASGRSKTYGDPAGRRVWKNAPRAAERPRSAAIGSRPGFDPTKPLYRELRPGRFLVQGDVVRLAKMMGDHRTDFLQAWLATPDHDPDWGEKTAALMDEVVKRLLSTLSDTAVLIARPLNQFQAMLVSNLGDALFRTHPAYREGDLRRLFEPGTILMCFRELAQSRQRVRSVWIHEEMHRQLEAGRVAGRGEVVSLDAFFARLLEFAGRVPLPDAVRAECGVVAPNLREFLVSSVAEHYHDFDADEFWTRVGEKAVTDGEWIDNAWMPSVYVNMFVDRALRAAQSDLPDLHRELEAALQVVATLRARAEAEAEVNMLALPDPAK